MRLTAAVEIQCQGVLFDCDGVLVDSRQAGEDAWRTWAGEFGLDADELLATIHGRRSQDTVDRSLPASERGRALARIEELELLSASTTRALPGAAELLRTVLERAAIVTSASSALVRARLQAAGLLTPAVVVTADDVRRGKPDPEPYRYAAQLLGLPVSQCVVVEDSPHGIAAAWAAGAGGVIGIGASADGADEQVPDLDHVVWIGTGLLVNGPHHR